ncbi:MULTISPECIES: potassium-transporting ATPase subunit F [Paenibacillus]|nr:potassium-transporting ATPase subunit F [Paenibacillus alba]
MIVIGLLASALVVYLGFVLVKPEKF